MQPLSTLHQCERYKLQLIINKRDELIPAMQSDVQETAGWKRNIKENKM